MLSEIQQNKFTNRAKNEVLELLKELKIFKLTDDTIGKLQDELVSRVSGLVSAKDEGKIIDNELLKIYDLLTDIVWDNEDDLEFLNEIFFN